MTNRTRRLLAICIAVVLCTAYALVVPRIARADETVSRTHDIYEADDLLAMARDPSGSYRLMADIDLGGVPWTPLTFSGTLDGNGHAILNAHIVGKAEDTRTSYDGNMKSYDTAFAGFFGLLEGATVRDVEFLGIDVSVETSEPTYAGGVCGYMADGALIENCVVEGSVSLDSTGASFGVGGIAGFGCGRIEGCTADVTLVCRDLDVEYKDEQFMGGAFANGFIDLIDNDVTIRGYDSDHGYVHNGGLIGMHIDYAGTEGHECYVTGNHVEGRITFFEDNVDRRAYCAPIIGENMSYNVEESDNTNNFERDERFEYDVDLLPHTCTAPTWTDEVIKGDCERRGYTLHTCDVCGYEYRSDWTAIEHAVDTWTPARTGAADGREIRKGTCTRCGATVYEASTSKPAEATDDAEEGQRAKDGDADGTVRTTDPAGAPTTGILAIVAWGAVVLCVVFVAVIGVGVWLGTRRRSKRPPRRAGGNAKARSRQRPRHHETQSKHRDG